MQQIIYVLVIILSIIGIIAIAIKLNNKQEDNILSKL
jgi:hypothetical protein